MSSRWTRRRNGRLMATLRLEAYVDQGMVRWIQEKASLSEAAALDWLRKQYQSGLGDYYNWRVPALVDGELEMLHVDGIAAVKSDGGEVWED